MKPLSRFPFRDLILLLVLLTGCHGEPSIHTPISNTAAQSPVQTLSSTPTLTAQAHFTLTPRITSSPTPTASPTVKPPPLNISILHIPAPSLKGNLLGDAEKQAVQIILPPSYETLNLHYPVVYFLPGFGSATDGQQNYFLIDQLAALIASGQLKEMILVVPTGANRVGGSFYVNSSVSGNWEDFIVNDVVGYIDAHYRTIPEPAGRGIGGHSMGGFGAINLAMRHPDIFSAAYGLSPGLFDENGLGDTYMFDTENKIRTFLVTHQKALAAMTREAAIQEMSGYEGALQFTVAYGIAFVPNPKLGPPFFDYPFEMKGDQVQRIPLVWERWQNGLGGWAQKVQKYHENLAKLRGIVIDYGTADAFTWIPRGSEYLAQLLTSAGISNQIYHFQGNHNDHIEERLLTVMLPFFNQTLADPSH